jgi:hypothetical protein
MHTVMKKALLALALASAAAGTAHAAEVLYQTSNIVRMRGPADAGYLARSNLFALTNAATTASAAQDLPPTVSPIPEPPVYIMLLIGVGLVSLVARRHKAPAKFSKVS